VTFDSGCPPRDDSRRSVSPSVHNECPNGRKKKTEDEVCCVDVCQRHWNEAIRNSPRLRETSIIYNAPIGLVARTRNERCRTYQDLATIENKLIESARLSLAQARRLSPKGNQRAVRLCTLLRGAGGGRAINSKGVSVTEGSPWITFAKGVFARR